ncbi:MAG: Gfo/Idh/MocA family oxidoreductase, partial [Chloroflexota bacterium]
MTQNVSVGVIGTSWWADAMYLPALDAHPNVTVTAFCGRNRERAQQMAERWNVTGVYTDYQEMIEQADLDAVIIATVNNTHYPMSMAALDAGLHVLCEKPLALNAADAAVMRDRAEAAGVVHAVPFTYRFMPTARYVKSLIEDGYIGTPYHLNMRYYTGYAREGDYAWRFDTEIAGSGVLGDIASHFIYLAEWLYGEIATVLCQLGHIVERPPTRPNGEPYAVGDDMAMVTLGFANGAYGLVHATAVCYEDTPFGQTHHMEFHGSGGTLYSFTDWDTVQEVRGARVGEGMLHDLPMPEKIWGDARRDTVHNTYRDIFRQEGFMIRGFIDNILTGTPADPSF